MAIPWLSILLFAPAVGAAVVWALGRTPASARRLGIGLSIVPLALASWLFLDLMFPGLFALPTYDAGSGAGIPGRFVYTLYESAAWVPQLSIAYVLGVDPLSTPLIFLTGLLTTLALVFSKDEHHRPAEYYALFLLLEATVFGVFLALDFFLFMVFWELQLVPMYFLIAVWGGPRRRYASLKFFFYTFFASIPVLLGVFAFYFYGGTFDMTALIVLAADRTLFPAGTELLQNLLFLALLAGFGTKLPTWPLHTWLPDAHVEAPTAGSVILAGVLLKLGGYALIRVNVQMLPQAGGAMWWATAALGVISILYGALVCLAQDDLKRMVAFSSVSHMGFVTLGISAGSVAMAAGGPLSQGAVFAFGGAIFMMFAHGLISAAMFMVAGGIGHTLGTRNISELGGIAARAPRYTTFMVVAFLASLGLPGLVGFVAELTVFFGVYAAFGWWVLVPLATVVLTAAYFIWAMQRAVFGPLRETWEAAPDAKPFEVGPLVVLSGLFAVFGLLPALLLTPIDGWVASALAVL